MPIALRRGRGHPAAPLLSSKPFLSLLAECPYSMGAVFLPAPPPIEARSDARSRETRRLCWAASSPSIAMRRSGSPQQVPSSLPFDKLLQAARWCQMHVEAVRPGDPNRLAIVSNGCCTVKFRRCEDTGLAEVTLT